MPHYSSDNNFLFNAYSPLLRSSFFNTTNFEKIGTPSDLTGITSISYLDSISKSLSYFSDLQLPDGSILDPYLQSEIQYATPCYAYCAALISHHANDHELRNRAILAFEKASIDLCHRQAANAHEDFYPSPLAHAYRFLKNHIDSDTANKWKSRFNSINPDLIYRHAIGGSGGAGSNWNCKALVGEFLLYKEGLKPENSYIGRSLLCQQRLFDMDVGMYTEGPFIYDIFPRAWLYDMLQCNFNLPSEIKLAEFLDKGALTSLFLQSSCGSIPLGGRTGMHLWGDALQILIFEIAASRLVGANEISIAGSFKRAARKSFLMTEKWRRNSGEHYVVKNKYDPSLQYGYYGYTSHTHYNLLLLTILGYSWEHGHTTDFLAEKITPSESSQHIIELKKPFNCVFASHKGTCLQIALSGYSGQTPRGLLNVQFQHTPSQIPFCDGTVESPAFRLPGHCPGDLSCGLEWQTKNEVFNFFDPKNIAVNSNLSQIKYNADSTEFSVSYSDSHVLINENFLISIQEINVQYEFSGNANFVNFVCPLFFYDGKTYTDILVDKNQVVIKYQDSKVRIKVEGIDELNLSETPYSHRSGQIKKIMGRLVGKKATVKFIHEI